MTKHEELWFPKYWVIEEKDDPRRYLFKSWFSEYYDVSWWIGHVYYWYEWTDGYGWTNCHEYIERFKNNPTLITLDQREEWALVDEQETTTEHEKLGFPQYWVIEKTDDKRRDLFHFWFNEFYDVTWWYSHSYYWYEWTNGCDWTFISSNPKISGNNLKLITLDQREERTKQKKSQTKLSSPVRSCNYDSKTRTSDTIDWIKITDLKEELQTNKNRNKEINKTILQHRNLFSNPNK